MANTFFNSYHMPLIMIMLPFFWIMIYLRVRAFYRQSERWRSFSGISVGCSIVAGILLTVYIILNAGIFGLDQEIYLFFDGEMTIAGEEVSQPDPAKLTDKECFWIIGLIKSIMEMAAASRFLLTAALWTVKGSLFFVYIQCIPVVRPGSRVIFQCAGPIIAATLVVSLWLIYQSIDQILTWPTPDDIRQGVYDDGVRFIELDDATELTITVLNAATDLLLIFLALKSIKGLQQCSKVGNWLVLLMGSLTVCVAFIRVGFEVYSISCTEACYDSATIERLMTPIMVLGECEAFTAIIVSCLPSLRAALRYDEGEANKAAIMFKSESNSSLEEGIMGNWPARNHQPS